MENILIIIICIPITWFIGCLGYQILHLIYLWTKHKFQNIKEKEFNLWD